MPKVNVDITEAGIPVNALGFPSTRTALSLEFSFLPSFSEQPTIKKEGSPSRIYLQWPLTCVSQVYSFVQLPFFSVACLFIFSSLSVNSHFLIWQTVLPPPPFSWVKLPELTLKRTVTSPESFSRKLAFRFNYLKPRSSYHFIKFKWLFSKLPVFQSWLAGDLREGGMPHPSPGLGRQQGWKLFQSSPAERLAAERAVDLQGRSGIQGKEGTHDKTREEPLHWLFLLKDAPPSSEKPERPGPGSWSRNCL